MDLPAKRQPKEKQVEPKVDPQGIQIHFGNAELIKIRLLEANNKMLFEMLTEFRKIVKKLEEEK